MSEIPSRINILGVGVHPINMDQALDAIDGWIARDEKHYVCLTPIYSILACQDDPDLKQVFNQSGLTTPDGMPLVWISRASGHPRANRVYGPDVMQSVAQRSVTPGYRHVLLGGHSGVPERVRDFLEVQFPGIQVVGCLSPAFGGMTGEQDAALVAEINAASPDIVWVALGSPRQEKWMAEHVEALNAHVLIGVGAAFDFLSGRKRQAPRWIQRSGLEWLFRLATEPRRLWRRYLRYPHFLVLYLAQVLGLKDYDFEQTGVQPPALEPQAPADIASSGAGDLETGRAVGYPRRPRPRADCPRSARHHRAGH